MNSTINLATRLNSITNAINFYYSAIVIPIGVVLNLASIYIFARSSSVTKKNVIINLLYIGLGAYDILALINSILFAQLLPSLGIYLVNYSAATCIGLNWWRKVVIQAPSWMQVIITLERYLNVVHANRSRLFKKKRNVTALLLSVFFSLTLVNMSHAWYYISNVVEYNNNRDDETLRQAIVNVSEVCTCSNAVSLLSDLVNVFSRFVIPFGIMIALNVLLSKNLYASKKRTATKNRSFKHERNYTLTVIGFNVLFFVLNLPWAVYYILNHIQASGIVLFDSSLDNAILGLMNSIVFSIFYLNNLSSFLLNLIFNTVFRKQFFSLTRGVWKVSQVHSSTQHNTTNNTINTVNTIRTEEVLKY